MKRSMFFVLLMMLLSFSVVADEKPAPPEGRPAVKKMPNQPVYATQMPAVTVKNSVQNATPEVREKMDADRRRRFEIMVLISAYKLMPENERQPLRAELLKRIEEDFQSVIAEQKERIAQAETDLTMLRAELADREARSEELIERELDRLVNMPMPSRQPRTMPPRSTPGERPSQVKKD